MAAMAPCDVVAWGLNTARVGVVREPASHRIGGTYGFVSGSPTVLPPAPHLPTSPRISCMGTFVEMVVGGIGGNMREESVVEELVVEEEPVE